MPHSRIRGYYLRDVVESGFGGHPNQQCQRLDKRDSLMQGAHGRRGDPDGCVSPRISESNYEVRAIDLRMR